MRGAAVIVVLLMALPAQAEKAVRRDRSDEQPEAEGREARPERRTEPTAAPTAAPTSPPPEERREERRATAEPTRAPDPTPEPTATPQPTATPYRPAERSDAEQRHPRPDRPSRPASPPPPTAAPAPPQQRSPDPGGGHREETRRDREGHDERDRRGRDHDRVDRHDPHDPFTGRVRRGHLGPHFHDTRYVPQSCRLEDESPAWAPADTRPHYDGMIGFRLLVDPPETRVLVDGYYAGIAEDFDGVFQRLHLPEGCHEITLSLAGHRTHRFLVEAAEGRTTRLRHEMRPGHGFDREDLSEGACLRRSEPAPVRPSESRRDFEMDRQRWFLAHGRLTAVIGLVRARLQPGLGTPASLSLQVEARSSGGAVVKAERESSLESSATGELLASYRIDLAPGRYTLRLNVREGPAGRASVVTETVDVPDLHDADVRVPSVFVLEAIRKAPAQADHPLSALVLEQSLAVPRFGNRFRAADSPILLFQFARRAQTSAVYASYVIFGPDGAPVARDGRVQSDQVRVTADRAVGAAAFGPLPLARYAPGRYRVVVTATDLDSLAASVQDAWFEVEPPAEKTVAKEAGR